MGLGCVPQTGRFFDGGRPATARLPAEPPDRDRPPLIVLSRSHDMPVDTFRMRRRIGYRDRELGELVVPADPETFETDLTSVPAVFAWLVPRDGAHLPAALLHDGLSHSPDEPPSYVSLEGRRVDAFEVDRVFRDAMCDTGTGPVRRWLMWSAVTIATVLRGRGVAVSRTALWRYRAAVVGTIAVVVALGALATLDLLDVAGPPGVPWMRGSFGAELGQGLAGALVVPLVLAVSWGRLWAAGLITGIALAVLLHVTVVVAAVTLIYRAAEGLTRRAPVAAVVLAAGLLAAAVVVFALSLW